MRTTKEQDVHSDWIALFYDKNELEVMRKALDCYGNQLIKMQMDKELINATINRRNGKTKNNTNITELKTLGKIIGEIDKYLQKR